MQPAGDLDAALERIEALYDAEDFDRARKELRRARKRFPEDLTLKEWDAVFAADEGRAEEALRILDGVLAEDPDRPFASRERAAVLAELWRFEEAVAGLRGALYRELFADDPVEEAQARFELASSLDHLGRAKEAEKEFQRAARLAPDECPIPQRMPRVEFERLVQEALDAIPERFHPYLKQVIVKVEDYPPRHRAPAPDCLGLYDGLPRTERGHQDREHLDTVFVFQRTHELLGLEPDELREEVRKTVVHEIAHHFGLGEEDMGEYA